ncbi:MAG: HU family DNA-binding protein [Deltaproteobacteria bacterium]|nr:HU family DNA-binding protein [Deltaproteobacteria bacterium]
MSELSDKTGLTKREVQAVFEGLRELIKQQLGKRGPGEFVLPDLVKLKLKAVPAQKNKKFRNPGTGEVFYKDVKASKKLRATPLKKLKDLVI